MLEQPIGTQRDTADVATISEIYAGEVMPGLQARSFSSLHRMFPTRTVRRDGPVDLLPHAPRPLGDYRTSSRGGSFDLYDYVSRNRTAGLLVLHQGRIVLQQHELGTDADTLWPSMSVAKSISSTLVGVAIQDGFIGGVGDLLVDYLPALRGSAFDGVTIRQLLQMTSGARWNDASTDPGSERSRMLELQQAQRPGSILQFMATLPRVAEPGTKWNYSTGETHVVGALLKAATGRWLSDYLSERIWSRLGMQADAIWWLESPGGLEVAGSGLSATLCDVARFGRFIARGGTIDGASLLPPGWIEEASAPFVLGGERVDYGYMWWPVPDASGSFADRAFGARGIFGQFLYVNPAKDVVIAVHSARSKPRFAEAVLDNDFFNATVAHLTR